MNRDFPRRAGLAAAMFAAVVAAPAAPPVNDNFASAVVLPTGGGTTAADNREATVETGEQNTYPVSRSIWYRWTPAVSGYAGVRTSFFVSPAVDTVVAVYQGNGLAGLRALAIGDDLENGATDSYVVFPAVAGTAYSIQAWSYGGSDAGQFALTVQPAGPASLGLFVGGAQSSLLNTSPNWGRLVQFSQNFELRNSGTGPLVGHLTSDNPMAVFGENRFVIAPGDPGVPTTLNLATAFGLPGTSLGYIRAVSPAGAGNQNSILFTVNNIDNTVPNNDNFANAYEITSPNVVINGKYENATAESGEPDLSGTNTVWYKFRAPTTGTVTLTSDGSTVPDPRLHVYTGNAVSALTPVGSDDDSGAGANFLWRGSLGATNTYYFRVRNVVGTATAGALRFRFNYAKAPFQAPGTPITAVSENLQSDFAGWTAFGAPVPGATSLTTGSRFSVNVQPAPAGTTRVLGWVSSSAVNMPAASLGPFGAYATAARARFAIHAAGQSNPGATNQIPNMRLRVAHRFAATAMLDLQHHGNSDPAAETLGADLAPSRDPLRPSVYTVYLPALGVPAVNNTAEPILRAFEAFSADPQDNGSLNMTESSIEPVFFPALISPVSIEQDARGRLMKVYDAATGDLASPTVTTLALNPTTLQDDLASPRPTVTGGTFGVTLDTSMVPANRIGVAAADFISGTVADTSDRTRRVRVEPESLYRIRFHATSTRPSSANAQIRFRARTSKFVFNHRLEVGPGNGASSANNTIAGQFLPGIGCQNPDRENGETNGGWYTLYFPTPMDPAIRPEFPGKSLTVSMPNLANQPGPGDPAISRRDLAVGIDLIDSLGAGANAAVDQGQVTLDRITIEQMTLPD